MVRKKIIKVKSKIEQVLEILEIMEQRLSDFAEENKEGHQKIRKSLE